MALLLWRRLGLVAQIHPEIAFILPLGISMSNRDRALRFAGSITITMVLLDTTDTD